MSGDAAEDSTPHRLPSLAVLVLLFGSSTQAVGAGRREPWESRHIHTKESDRDKHIQEHGYHAYRMYLQQKTEQRSVQDHTTKLFEEIIYFSSLREERFGLSEIFLISVPFGDGSRAFSACGIVYNIERENPQPTPVFTKHCIISVREKIPKRFVSENLSLYTEERL